MKVLLHIALTSFCLLLVQGCHDDEVPENLPSTPVAEVAGLHQIIENERADRASLEIRLQREQATRSHWQMITFVVAIVGVLLFLIGLAAGSKAVDEVGD